MSLNNIENTILIYFFIFKVDTSIYNIFKKIVVTSITLLPYD
jgi:hypothetical protein